MLTDFHGRANQSFVLWEQSISLKAWTLSVVPYFSLSPRRVALSCVGWFSQVLAFRSLYYPWGKMGDYSWSILFSTCTISLSSLARCVRLLKLQIATFKRVKWSWNTVYSFNFWRSLVNREVSLIIPSVIQCGHGIIAFMVISLNFHEFI